MKTLGPNLLNTATIQLFKYCTKDYQKIGYVLIVIGKYALFFSSCSHLTQTKH